MNILFEHTKDRYLRSPTFQRDGDKLLLKVRCSDGAEERLISLHIDETNTIYGAEQAALSEIQSLDVSEDRAACDGDWKVWVERTSYQNTVWVQREGAAQVKVWQAHATAAAPTVLCVDEGAWVAFHHNLREDNLQPDIAKWVAVRFVSSDNRVLEVDAEVAGRDRDMKGEEQSFEFPSLAVTSLGALIVVGRGAHQMWRQDITAAGFAERSPVGEGGWGCRGRRAACTVVDSKLWVAWRERRGIRVLSQGLPSGERPALRPAEVELSTLEPVADQRPTEDFVVRHGLRTLFGDIHQHSAHSDGIGAADEPYLRARYRYGDDFCALTDHESFLGKRIEAAEWGYLQQVAESHNEPGTFATLLAYEWTAKMHPGPGHKVCYFPTVTRKVYSRDHLPEGEAIVAAVKSAGGFAVPHHVGWTGANEEAHDEVGQPVWEICSCHGCYEHWAHELGQRGELRDQMVDAVLKRGHRFGFIASSDGHGLLWHHGVARKRDPFRTGLTAVQASACTREDIMDAIRNRRCYATSGAKIIINLEVDGQPMGAEAKLDAASVLVEVAGTAPLKSVELVDAKGIVNSWQPSETRFEVRVDVHADRYLYLRVRQQDGEMAWSSPVFTRKTAA